MAIYVKDIIDVLTNPTIHIENTVDNLLFGNSLSEVSGVAVTFLATQEIIEKAKSLGLNLIISHEGIFYSHHNNELALQNDPIYLMKRKTIEDSDIAIFRYHDYIHKFKPDGITAGLVQALGWQDNEVENLQTSSIIELQPTTLNNLISHIKNRLGIDHIRFMGDLSILCSRIGLLVGYRGSNELTLSLFNEKDVDVVIYGEGPEWETPEYVRDAIYQGRQKALIILGHGESEMPGMEYLAKSLQEKFPSIPVNFIPGKSIFQTYY
jgi:putative NIF3 family GTP cyclohydrolase 1 type 2